MTKLRHYISLTFIILSGCTLQPVQEPQQITPELTPEPTEIIEEKRVPVATPTPAPIKPKEVVEYKKTYHENGQLAYIITYKNNLKINKEVFTYYNSGQLSIQTMLVDGLKTGQVKYYSKSGDIWRTEEYLKGKKNGFSISYYEPNVIAKKQHYTMGLADGEQEAFLPNGKRSDKWIYQQGKLLSHFKFQYFKNGNLQLQQAYQNGKKNGLSNEFSEDGSLLKSVNYKDNLVNGKELLFYQSGQIKSEKTYLNSKQHGSSSGYYAMGALQWESDYLNGLREGVYKEYYQNGQLKKKINYRADLQNGSKRFFHKNGLVKYELMMRDSKAEGLLTEFDDQGNIILTQHYTDGAVSKESGSFLNGYLLWLNENDVQKLVN